MAGGGECPAQCADEHLHYCRREQGPTYHRGWCDTLVNFFNRTGTQDPRLRLIQPTRAKQDTNNGPRVTLDSLYPHMGRYCRKGVLSSPTQGAAYHPPAALMYILRDVLVDGKNHALDADATWPELLRPRPRAPTLVWLVTTDAQCTQAAQQAQLWANRWWYRWGRASPGPGGYPAVLPC